MNEYEDEIELMDYMNVIWKRKWLIILPTFFLVAITGIVSFLLPEKWEVDSIIVPSKFLIQTEQGQFEEVLVVDPKQIAGQINQGSYDNLLAARYNIERNQFPDLKAENLRDTNLIRISVRYEDPQKAKSLLLSLFTHLKRDFDRKIDVELKGVDTAIFGKENLIRSEEIAIKDKFNAIKIKENEIKAKKMDIQSKEIGKTKLKQEILNAENRIKISAERVQNILEEMKSVKQRIDELEEQLKEVLSEKKQGSDAVGLLLYSNEVQQNFRYYNTLDEKLSTEKITQENLILSKTEKEEEIKQVDTQIEKHHTEIDTLKTQINEIHNEIDKTKNRIAGLKNDISLLEEKKGRIDYTQLLKEPTSSFSPVSPRKKLNVLIAGILGLMIFTMAAFFLEYVEKHKTPK